jgi:tetraacyldisaccharide 4'-kinase
MLSWRSALLASWFQGPRYFTYLLLPLSFFFSILVFFRRCFYRFGIFPSQDFDVPVIVVGNITVGGNGKTPLVIFLANYFREKGYKPGIVMRGFKGKAKHWPHVVYPDTDTELVGDEAVMMAQLTQLPVVVAPDRVAAVRQLLDDFSCDLVLSDDGLQHYGLGRKREIAVLDGENRLGNGYCLPAGPLREPAGRLQQVDFVVVNGGAPKAGEYAMSLVPDKIYNLEDATQSWALPVKGGTKVHAIAGIGFPERFFNSLRQLGFEVIPHPFPDHYAFEFSDINLPDYPIIMTAKDAVKCQSFADERHWCLSVRAELGQDFLDRLIEP